MLKNSGISTPSIDTYRTSRDPYQSFKSQHRRQNPRSGLLCCHRYSILTLNLTLNKMKYTKPLNNFVPLCEFLEFWNFGGASNTMLTTYRGRLLDKRDVYLEVGVYEVIRVFTSHDSSRWTKTE